MEPETSIQKARELLEEGKGLIKLLRYDQALALLKQAEAILEEYSDDLSLTDQVNIWLEISLVQFHKNQAHESVVYANRALELCKQQTAIGSDHELTARAFFQLSIGKYLAHKLDEAETYAKAAISICFRNPKLGPQYPKLFLFYNALAGNYATQDKFNEAIETYQSALGVLSHHLDDPKSQLDVAMIHKNLAVTYRDTHNYAAAELHIGKAIEIRRNHPEIGPEHPTMARTISTLAGIYRDQDRYSEAEQHYRASLTILKNHPAFGAEHPEYAADVANLATNLKCQHRYAESVRLFEESLGVFIRHPTFGESHPRTASLYNNMGNLLKDMGKYNDAEVLYLRCLKIRIDEPSIGANHSHTATIYDNLGLLYRHQRRYEESISHHQKALEIFRQRPDFGSQSERAADVMSNLSIAHFRSGDLKSAEMYSEHALEIYQKLFGQDQHPSMMNVYHHQAEIYIETRQFDKGIPLLQKVLDFYHHHPEFGPAHPRFAWTQQQLAEGYLKAENFELSINHFEYALNCYLDHPDYGSSHPTIIDPLEGLGKTHLESNQPLQAIPYFLQALELQLEFRAREVSSLERTSQRSFDQDYREVFAKLCQALSQAKAQSEDISVHLEQTFNLWLTLKCAGYLLDNLVSQLAAQGTPEQQQQARELLELRDIIAATSREQQIDPEKWKALNQQYSQLEGQLARSSKDFELFQQLQQVRLDQIQTHLRPGEAYLDYVQFDQQTYVFSLDGRSGAVGFFTLGSSQEIRQHIEELLAAIQPHQTNLDAFNGPESPAGWLYQKLIAPVIADWTGLERVVISPDAALHFLPFDLLWDGQGWLLERCSVQLIPSGRDWVRIHRASKSSATGPSVLFGNPDYGGALETETTYCDPLRLRRIPQAAETIAPLPGSAEEIERILGLLAQNGLEAVAHTEGAASEANLKRVVRPQYLHIAAHGLVLGEEVLQEHPELENPFLRAWVLLSGAGKDLNGTGWVNAQQLSSLDLRGTELVVLSACQTARGQAQAGEGLAGLSQALFMAGASATLTTLWPVSDYVTAEFMEVFYERLLAGEGPDQALVQAKRLFAWHPEYRQPYFWAPFVLTGAVKN